MKLDTELVRDILVKLEELPFEGRFHDIVIEGRTDDEIIYRVMTLDEAGLVEAVELSTMDGICWKPQRLTYAGHQFLDAARSNTVWQRAKGLALKSTGTLTIEGLKLALPHVMKALIGSTP